MSWEPRGHLARNGPKARKALTGATHPSHPSPARGTAPGAMSWERGHLARNGPKARKAPGATHPSHPLPRPSHGPGSDVLGARASCPQRAEGPQGADRSDTPEPPTPPPEARPRERCPGRGHLARNGPKARKAPTGATHPSHPLPRPRHDPGSDGVSRKRRRPVRLPMWRACGPLAGGTPALPGMAPEPHSQTLRRRAIPKPQRGG